VPQIITLLTDFGTADGYVAEMKGVLLSAIPAATVVDISHDIAAQDVEAARLALARYWRRFPEGTVHVIVVDPGVGSTRASIAVESDGQFLVGPDNGVLSPALFSPDAVVVVLPVPARAAATFHGRDIFAPAAIQLATGIGIRSLGAAMSSPVRRRTPEAVRRADGSIAGEILTIDRFGNALTNIVLRGNGMLLVDGQMLPIVRTYSDVEIGEATALTGSSGFLEVAVRNGHAAQLLQLLRGDQVVLFRQAQ
jgi:S-adenosylmethionine hydrolase